MYEYIKIRKLKVKLYLPETHKCSVRSKKIRKRAKIVTYEIGKNHQAIREHPIGKNQTISEHLIAKSQSKMKEKKESKNSI